MMGELKLEEDNIPWGKFCSFIDSTYYELTCEYSILEILTDLKEKNKIHYERDKVIIHDSFMAKRYNNWKN